MARPLDEAAESAADELTEEARTGRRQAVVDRLSRFREGGMVVAVGVTCLVFTLKDPAFIHTDNLANIGSQVSYFAILAVGMTFVLIAGEIDLSVGSMVGLVTVIFGLLLEHHWNIWVACLASLLAGTAMGSCNGILSVMLRVPTIIVTLGMLNVYRGIAYLLTNGYPVENYDTSGPFFQIGQESFLTALPYTAIITIIFAIIGSIILRRTVFGHQVYAMGSNLRAAQLSGIPVQRIRILVLSLLGFAGGLAALLTVSETQTANPNTGIGYELNVIAAVIIGGAKLTGGSGSVLASVLGMLLIGIISNGLVLTGVSIYAQVVVSGAIVVIAVAIDRFFTRRRESSRSILGRTRPVAPGVKN